MLIRFSVPFQSFIGPSLADISKGEIEQLEQRLIARERPPVLCDLPKTNFDRLNGIGRIDHISYFWWIEKEGGQCRPVTTPGLADRWVFLAPALLELAEHQCGLFDSRSLVDAPKVSSDFL